MGVIGTLVMSFGIVGLISHSRQTHPIAWGIWFTGGALLHDLVLAPVVFFVGKRIKNLLTGRTRLAVQMAMILTGVIALVSIPALSRAGLSPTNPSILPRNYLNGFLILVGLTWGTCLIAAALVRDK